MQYPLDGPEATGWLWKNPRSKFFASLDGYEHFIAKSSRSRYVRQKKGGIS
jgi:hypothetical protein